VRLTKTENQLGLSADRVLELAKRFFCRQRYLLAAASLLLILTALLVLPNRPAWEICVDGKIIGCTLDQKQAEELAHSILAADGSLEEQNAVLSFNRIKRAEAEVTTYEELKTNLLMLCSS